MSLPGSGKGAQGGNGEGTLLTIMLVVAAVFMVVGTIILSVPLKQFYDKYLWNW